MLSLHKNNFFFAVIVYLIFFLLVLVHVLPAYFCKNIKKALWKPLSQIFDYVIRKRSQTKNESKLTMKTIKNYKRIYRENIPFYRLNTGVHLS